MAGHPAGGWRGAVYGNAGGWVRSLSARLQPFSWAKTSGRGQQSGYLRRRRKREKNPAVFSAHYFLLAWIHNNSFQINATALLVKRLLFNKVSRDSELTWQDEGQVLQVWEQEILTGPQVAHCGSRCVWTSTQLVDHLREKENQTNTKKFEIFCNIKSSC